MFVTLLFVAALGLTVATVLYVARLVRFDRAEPRAGHWVMGAATAVLGVAAVIASVSPEEAGIGAGAAVILWLGIGGAALGLVFHLARKTPLAGPIVAPLVAVVALAVALKALAPAAAPPLAGIRALTALHVSATLTGFLLFIPAFVISALYLGQVYRLKTKQRAGARVPSLVTLERAGWRLIYIGFPLYTVGILLGVVWQDSLAIGLRPQILFAAVSWCIYAFIIYRRLATGWRGARAAVAVMAGFTVTLGAVLLYMLR